MTCSMYFVKATHGLLVEVDVELTYLVVAWTEESNMDHNTDKTQEAPKVVSLFARKQDLQEPHTDSAPDTAPAKDSPSFLESMRKNAENAERLRKERLKANQGVLKSYRIKN